MSKRNVEAGIAADSYAVAKALGSSEHSELAIGSPSDLPTLVARFDQRLKSSGGRPTDPAWTLTRRVPFKPDTWNVLRDAATKLSERTGHSVSAAQLGADIIEQNLHELEAIAQRAHRERPGPSKKR